MPTKSALTIVLALALGVAGGYLLRAETARPAAAVLVAEPDTFSRVKNTRNALDALGRGASSAIVDGLVAYRRLPKGTPAEASKAAAALERLRWAAEGGWQDFAGTEQQPMVAEALLRVLREGGRFGEWTDVYLRTVYEHPMSPIVFTSAPNAMQFSNLAGEQPRVLEALARLNEFPLKPGGKALIRAALKGAGPTLASAFCAGAGEPARRESVKSSTL